MRFQELANEQWAFIHSFLPPVPTRRPAPTTIKKTSMAFIVSFLSVLLIFFIFLWW